MNFLSCADKDEFAANVLDCLADEMELTRLSVTSAVLMDAQDTFHAQSNVHVRIQFSFLSLEIKGRVSPPRWSLDHDERAVRAPPLRQVEPPLLRLQPREPAVQ